MGYGTLDGPQVLKIDVAQVLIDRYMIKFKHIIADAINPDDPGLCILLIHIIVCIHTFIHTAYQEDGEYWNPPGLNEVNGIDGYLKYTWNVSIFGIHGFNKGDVLHLNMLIQFKLV